MLISKPPKDLPWRVIAVDPAARCFDYAVFEGRRLVKAGKAERPAEVGPPSKCAWVIEDPQNYERFGAAHRDLDRLRARIAMIETYACRHGHEVYKVRPHTWKGNVPKVVTHRRCCKVLDECEKRVIAGPHEEDYDHNTYDAVAIGIWATRRTRRGAASGKSRRPRQASGL